MTVTTQSKVVTQEAVTQNPQTWLLWLIQLWGLILLTLHLAAVYLPQETAWSLWPYTFLPRWLQWGLALLAASLILPPANAWLQTRLEDLWRFLVTSISTSSFFTWPPSGNTQYAIRPTHQAPVRSLPVGRTRTHQLIFISIALLAGLLFWLARLRHLRWGDSYLLSVALSYSDLDLRVIYNWQAPLTVFLHQRLWQFVADPLFGWPVEAVYAATSILCGMIFVYVLLNFTHHLGRDALEAAVLAGLVLATGSMQLFFGYVENYVIISVGLLATMFLAWRVFHQAIRPVWPVLALSLTNAFHPSTVFLWPALWWLVWRCRRRGQVSLLPALLQLGLPPLLTGGAVFALMESGQHGLAAFTGVDRPGGGDGIWFVPLFEITTEWQRYTMFSAAHFLDWANLHLLISPFGLPLIGVILVGVRYFHLTLFETEAERDYATFLGAASGLYILFTWLWNADYGMQKDWDLFAPSAFVYTLWAGYLLVRLLKERPRLAQAGLFIIGVSLLHTAAWIFTNTHSLPRT